MSGLARAEKSDDESETVAFLKEIVKMPSERTFRKRLVRVEERQSAETIVSIDAGDE